MLPVPPSVPFGLTVYDPPPVCDLLTTSVPPLTTVTPVYVLALAPSRVCVPDPALTTAIVAPPPPIVPLYVVTALPLIVNVLLPALLVIAPTAAVPLPESD